MPSLFEPEAGTRVTIGLIGDHDPGVLAHQGIPRVLARASERLGLAVLPVWLATPSLAGAGRARLAEYDALWCVPASPYASTDGALAAIRYARENAVPFLGTCGGFQHALLEYARNALGIAGAAHAELDPLAPAPVIAPLSCSLVEKSGAILFEPGSRLGAIYGVAEVEETYHCNYGLSPSYEARLAEGDLRIAARDRAGEVRAVELASHPFFTCTLFQPERAGLREQSHPLIEALVLAASDRARIAHNRPSPKMPPPS